jgi:hypothetical protein
VDYNDYLELCSEWRPPNEHKAASEDTGAENQEDQSGSMNDEHAEADSLSSLAQSVQKPPVLVGNPMLGAVIREVQRLLEKPIDPPKKPEDAKPVPLALFVHGGPFAGVSRQCAKIAELRDLEIIKVSFVHACQSLGALFLISCTCLVETQSADSSVTCRVQTAQLP